MKCVQKWLEDLKESSRVTWRISKTWPEEGRINLFKQHLYCQHAADKRVSGVRTSKCTGCPATPQITVHRFGTLSSALHIGYFAVYALRVQCNNSSQHTSDILQLL